ncbi:SET domain-containing protein [Ramicandelaber brevisporus]|nr:SET domain-containing protein [Ramicandelaber brevisporus]
MTTLEAVLEGFHVARPDTEHGLVAQRDFSAGDIVVTEPALAVVPLPPSSEDDTEVCEYCLCPFIGMTITCRHHCRLVHYCSKSCQTADWNRGHQILCAVYSNMRKQFDQMNENTFRDTLMLLKVNAAQITQDPNADYSIDAFDTLVYHRQDDGLETDTADIAKLVVKPLAQIYSNSNHANSNSNMECPTTDSLQDALARFQCNNHGVYDEQMFPVGEATFVLGSMLNHSCLPNCFQMYRLRRGRRPEVVIRCAVDVKQGEQLTIGYVDPLVDRVTRRIKLRERYNFKCTCVRCSHSDSTLDDRLVHLYADTDVTPSAKTAKTKFDALSQLESLLGCLTNVQQFECARKVVAASHGAEILQLYFSMTNPHSSTHAEIPLKLTALFSEEEEVQYALVTLLCYLVVYPRINPLTALQLYTVTKWLWNVLDDVPDQTLAIRLLKFVCKAARHELELTHGLPKSSSDQPDDHSITSLDMIEDFLQLERFVKPLA